MAQLGQTLTNLQNYNDEINDPVISTVGHTGQYSDLIGAPALAPVAYTGNYNSLNGTPNLAPVATTGSYNSLSGQPSYSTVANTGNYTDLVGAPVTPVFYSNLTPAQLGIVTAPYNTSWGFLSRVYHHAAKHWFVHLSRRLRRHHDHVFRST